jgi:tetratricopeptide (TPR) repeat protein
MNSQFSIAHSLAMLISLLLLPMPSAAALRQDDVNVKQLAAPTKSDDTRAAAQRAYAEAWQLFQQGTAESRREAIKKYEEVLELWRAIGDRSQEASTLHGIGLVYYSLGEKQKTLDYYNQSLALRRTLNNPAGEAGMLWAIAGVYND